MDFVADKSIWACIDSALVVIQNNNNTNKTQQNKKKTRQTSDFPFVCLLMRVVQTMWKSVIFHTAFNLWRQDTFITNS